MTEYIDCYRDLTNTVLKPFVAHPKIRQVDSYIETDSKTLKIDLFFHEDICLKLIFLKGLDSKIDDIFIGVFEVDHESNFYEASLLNGLCSDLKDSVLLQVIYPRYFEEIICDYDFEFLGFERVGISRWKRI